MKESLSGGGRSTSMSFSGTSIGRGFESAGPRISAPPMSRGFEFGPKVLSGPSISMVFDSGTSVSRPSFGGAKGPEISARNILQMPRLEAPSVGITDRTVPGKLAFTHTVPIWSRPSLAWSKPPEAVPKNIPGLEGFIPLKARPPEILDSKLPAGLKSGIWETVKNPDIKPEVVLNKISLPEITLRPEMNSDQSRPTPILSKLNVEQTGINVNPDAATAVGKVFREDVSDFGQAAKVYSAARKVYATEQEAKKVTYSVLNQAVSGNLAEKYPQALAGRVLEYPKAVPKPQEFGRVQIYPSAVAASPVEEPQLEVWLQLQTQTDEETKRKLELLRKQLRLIQEKKKKKEEPELVVEEPASMVYEKDDETEGIRRKLASEAVAKSFAQAKREGREGVLSSEIVAEMPEYDLQPKYVKSQLVKNQERRDGSYSRWVKDVFNFGYIHDEWVARMVVEAQRRKHPAVKISKIQDTDFVDEEKVKQVYDSTKPELKSFVSVVKDVIAN